MPGLSSSACFFYVLGTKANAFMFQQREDLEFSVGSKAAVWEVKDSSLTTDYHEEDGSQYHGNGYGGGRGYPPQGY